MKIEAWKPNSIVIDGKDHEFCYLKLIANHHWLIQFNFQDDEALLSFINELNETVQAYTEAKKNS